MRRSLLMWIGLTGACVEERGATVSYTWAPPYRPALVSIRVGQVELAGEAFPFVLGTSTIQISLPAPPAGATPVGVTLVLGTDTLAAVTGSVVRGADRNLTIQIVAGPLSSAFLGGCARSLGAVPIRGGAPADTLAVRWFETEPTDIVGPC